MHLSHHASISYALHTLCGHASILRASIFCAHFFPFSANTSTASSGEHWRVLARTHMLAACAQCLLHARYMLAASFLQALASILSRAYFYKGLFVTTILWESFNCKSSNSFCVNLCGQRNVAVLRLPPLFICLFLM